MTETGVAVTAPRAPSITSTLPSEWYHGESQWELDRRAVFLPRVAVVAMSRTCGLGLVPGD